MTAADELCALWEELGWLYDAGTGQERPDGQPDLTDADTSLGSRARRATAAASSWSWLTSAPSSSTTAPAATSATSKPRPRKDLTVSIPKTRGLLYSLAKLLGDYQAVRKGTVGKRVARRMAGRATGRGLGRLFR